MTKRFKEEDAKILGYGAGINSRASEGQIDPLECSSGENFVIDPGNSEFRPRPPIDLVSTTPNGAEIRGFVTLKKTDNTVTMLVQSGTNVYKWDGATYSLVGTVSGSAKLRGPREANWALDDKVIISDINLSENLHEWDGTTFQQITFLQSDGSSVFGAFRARYCVVDNERAFYGAIHESGNAFEHLLVSSKRGNHLIVSASDRPASSLGADAPWFLPMPQLKPINGMAFVFGILAISQQGGAFEKLTGSSAKDFAIDKLHYGSGAGGRESVVAISNDIIYGAPGHIESLKSTNEFGDVELDDLSFKIQPDVKTFNDWTLIYNPRFRRVYCFPAGTSEVWVLHNDFIGSDLSPWSKYTTQHAFAFQPSAVMMCLDPLDGLEYIFMGDASGNLYRVEGTGLAGDGGSANIIAKRTSQLYRAPLDAITINMNGWIEHRKLLDNTLSLRFLYAGEHVHDVPKSVTLSAVDFDTVYNDGTTFYGGDFYYGPAQENRLVRKTFGIPGHANQFQIETKIEGVNDFAITELGVRYDFAG